MSREVFIWTESEIAIVQECYAKGYTAAEIVAEFLPHRTATSVRSVRQREKERAKPRVVHTVRPVAEYAAPDGQSLAEVFAPAGSRDETDAEFLLRVQASAAKSIAKASAQKYATIRIPSDVPIGLVISSDWHVSTTGTDIDGLMSLAEFVAETPGLYSVAVGDLFDNAIKHRGGSVAGIADELRLLDIIVSRYRGKLLGTTSGNHDDWSKVFSGQDALREMARRHRIHYAPDELLWKVEILCPHDLEIVTAEYTIATRHQWRRHSNLNPTHACKTWLQEQQLNWETVPDVLAIGHNHVAAIGSEQFSGRDVHFLRMGAWQRDSSYARAKGFADYRPTAPTVVLPPTRSQRVACFADPQDAVQHMRGWRDVTA